MRNTILILVALLTLGACTESQIPAAAANRQAHPPVSNMLAGNWILQVENLRHEVVLTMTVRFSDQHVNTCINGDWKRLVVESYKTTDERFFPARDPLSYSVEDSTLIMGRNGICDVYLQLHGTLVTSKVTGEYVGFGLRGDQRLGYFTLTRGTK